MARRPTDALPLPRAVFHVVPPPFSPFALIQLWGGGELDSLPQIRQISSTLILYIVYLTFKALRSFPSTFPVKLLHWLTFFWLSQSESATTHADVAVINFSTSSLQNDGTEGERDDDGRKSKRRPRPEPLFIPPPKPSLFIAPPVYSSITPYQSHLRSPVRLADNPITMPPYTPPPILSPVREGSGLYFSTFLSSTAASGPGLPPPATPKSATRSLLRSSECNDILSSIYPQKMWTVTSYVEA